MPEIENVNLTVDPTLNDYYTKDEIDALLAEKADLANVVEVESALDSESVNALQNWVITAALEGKVDKVLGGTLLTAEQKEKLDDIEAGAEVNDIDIINIFGNNVLPDENSKVITLADVARESNLLALDARLTDSVNNNTAAIESLSENKVDKVAGKGLSKNDFTDSLKAKLDGIAAGATVNRINSIILNNETVIPDDNKAVDLGNLATVEELNTKVTAESGKGLSENNLTNQLVSDLNANTAARHTHSNKSILDSTTASFTTSEKTKLSSVSSGAEENIIDDVNIAVRDVVYTPTIAEKNATIDLTAAFNEKVDVELISGDRYKVLSDNNFTDTLKDKLDAIESNANNYTLPTATSSTLGGIMVGNNLTISGGVLSGKDVDSALNGSSTNPVQNKVIKGALDLKANSSDVTSALALKANSSDIYTKTEVYNKDEIDAELATKVDKVSGKVLSTNDFTDALLTKLNGIASGAEVNVQSDWNAISGDAVILNKPTNATTSASGFMSAADKTKLNGIAPGAQVNVIETIKVHGVQQVPVGTTIDIDAVTQGDVEEIVNDAISSLGTPVTGAYLDGSTISAAGGKLNFGYQTLINNSPVINTSAAASPNLQLLNAIVIGDTTLQPTNNTGTIDLSSYFNAKQNTLTSGTNIKTINGESLIGSGTNIAAAKSISLNNETKNASATGTVDLGTLVKSITLNGTSQTVSNAGAVNLGNVVTSLSVNGQSITPTNGVASFTTSGSSYSGTLAYNNWSAEVDSNGYYTNEVTVSSATATDNANALISLNPTSITASNIAAAENNWFYVKKATVSTGKIIFYATQPTTIDLPFTVKVVL